MDNTYQAPQGRLLSTLVIFCFVVGVLYTLFLVFKQANVNGDIATAEENSIELQTKIETLERDAIQTLFVAQEVKEGVEATRIAWSKVIRKFQDLTPPAIFFSSFSGGKAGELSLSGLADSADSVADMISVLGSSDDFSDAFVPSVTEGTTVEGQTVVSFNLSVNVVN